MLKLLFFLSHSSLWTSGADLTSIMQRPLSVSLRGMQERGREENCYPWTPLDTPPFCALPRLVSRVPRMPAAASR